MQREQLADSDLRTLVIRTLDHEPDASFQRVLAHLRSRQGRTVDSAESDRLHNAYETELAQPTGAHRIGAREAAALAAHQPLKLRRTELAGLAAGLIPFVYHLPTATPASVARGTGAVVAGGMYDLAAMVGGFLAIALGLVAVRLALPDISHRRTHFALALGIVLLGVYQTLFGLGLLHQLGLYRAG